MKKCIMIQETRMFVVIFNYGNKTVIKCNESLAFSECICSNLLYMCYSSHDIKIIQNMFKSSIVYDLFTKIENLNYNNHS